MLLPIHHLLVAVYLLLPAVMLGRALLRRRQGKGAALRRFWLTACGGIVVSAVICTGLAWAEGGKPIVSQVLLAGYFATALLILLNGFDFLLWRAVIALFRLRPVYDTWFYGLRAGLGMLLRGAVLFAVGLPYLLAASSIYRPHLWFDATPRTLLNRDFQPVSFDATDGTHLAGWWIPADAADARQTVVFCPGWSAAQATQIALTRHLLAAGYNVLSFDFRGTAASGGQLASFGDLERRDVLGAVRWLRSEHPAACRRLNGLGVNTGGAALLAAAADPSDDGQHIDAVAIYGTFDTLPHELDTLSARYLPPPVGWVLQHLGVPIASAHAGADLAAFSPIDAVRSLWPRPILIVQGVADPIVPIDVGRNLFDAATGPRDAYWIEHASAHQAQTDAGAARAVVHFFDTARSVL